MQQLVLKQNNIIIKFLESTWNITVHACLLYDDGAPFVNKADGKLVIDTTCIKSCSREGCKSALQLLQRTVFSSTDNVVFICNFNEDTICSPRQLGNSKGLHVHDGDGMNVVLPSEDPFRLSRVACKQIFDLVDMNTQVEKEQIARTAAVAVTTSTSNEERLKLSTIVIVVIPRNSILTENGRC